LHKKDSESSMSFSLLLWMQQRYLWPLLLALLKIPVLPVLGRSNDYWIAFVGGRMIHLGFN
jgi:hypothetical protein